ncbi:plasmid replication initiator TrfA [Ectopseudomonas mendocina]|uniref:plasmid replication initiator TrfA n=1 Tax=Ectopseudomonas mendocina TaxID=300 RepID=UPI000E1C02A2|nr:plasmid replication initiator TrfA [Pseudomonas mendocina]
MPLDQPAQARRPRIATLSQGIRVLEEKCSAKAQGLNTPEPQEQKAGSPKKTDQLFLPGLEDFMRAMPNHIARSSLFAPIARGRKIQHKNTVLVSRRDAVIKYSGEQLDESQADVWLHALHEAIRHGPLGESVTLNRAAFLRAIGRDTGSWQYKWLHRAMLELSFGMLTIEATKAGLSKLHIGRTRALHLIEGFDYDDELEAYTYRIDPRWGELFNNREFALIHWAKRLEITQGQDMAKAIQRLVATSADTEQRYSLDWLKAKLHYTSPMRKFKTALSAALKELERLEIIAGSRLELSTKGKAQASWRKVVHKRQKTSV